ncbi:hypothetical protein KFE25_001304 [Diacronema lutheri]|uniref:Uncharacterized protein n=1 Tax=Diacronema lutheri TaxID=2081491 RepID=A0A8J5XA25_DIALT|nr:hypothetical protein KFE25_001304 [Diacronema lutheri]
MRTFVLLVVGALASHGGLAAAWTARAPARAVNGLATGAARSRGACARMAAAKEGRKKGSKAGKKAAGFGGAGAPARSSSPAPEPDEFLTDDDAPDAQPPVDRRSALGMQQTVGGEKLVLAPPGLVPELDEVKQETVGLSSVELIGGDPFMRVQPERWAELRLPRASSNADVLQALCGVVERGALDEWVQANRDYVIKRFQVWLMAESIRRKQAGDEAGSAHLRTTLSQLIASNRKFDAPLAVAVEGREKALNAAFEQANRAEESKPTISELAGDAPLEQLGFWVVIASAREAWSDRLSETPPGEESLCNAMARKVGQMEQFLEAIELTPEIQVPPVPTLLRAMRSNELPTHALDDELVFRLGAILGCIECLRYAAFSALALRLSRLMDMVASGRIRPLDTGAPLNLPSMIEKAERDGGLSALIRYERTKERIDGKDTTVKLGELFSVAIAADSRGKDTQSARNDGA